MSEVTLPDERVGPVAKLIIVVTTIVALVVGRVTPRGLFLAHNVVNKQSEMKDFLAA